MNEPNQRLPFLKLTKSYNPGKKKKTMAYKHIAEIKDLFSYVLWEVCHLTGQVPPPQLEK